MNKIMIISLFVLVLLVNGCAKETTGAVCNKPYILVGTGCCLDRDDNGVCDGDEALLERIEEVEDACGNGVCEEAEDCGNCEKDCNKCFSLSDLQIDINNALIWKAILNKEKEDDIANYYTYTEPRAKLLGKFPKDTKAPTQTYQKVLPKRYILVNQIKDRQDYIKDSNEFYKYVIRNKANILEPVTEAKEAFQEEFKNGEILTKMFGNEAEKYTNSITYVEETILFDNITWTDAVGNKIVETVFVSEDHYNVNYPRQGVSVPTKKEFSGINYEVIVSVYCSPSLVITLYNKENYNEEGYYAFRLMDESFFINDIISDKKTILVDAIDVLGMCRETYSFSYE